jgi:hypothetical protein
MKPLSMACALALGLAFVAAAPAVLAQAAPPAASAAVAPAAPQLHAAMRSLWHGHIVSTRGYALAVHAGDKAGAQKAADAVVANARQIANAVAGFYGKDAGAGLLKLLAGHWAGVKALTDATKAGDKAGEQKAMGDLASNATALARFLADANPNWSEATLDGALMMHVDDHKTQLEEMMSDAPAAQQAKSWTEMQHHMDMIADVLASGIAKQFPNKAH